MAPGLRLSTVSAVACVLALFTAGCLQADGPGAPTAPVFAPVLPAPPPAPTTPSPAAPPASGTFRLEPLVDGLERPVGIVSARDGTGRLFILEQTGAVRVWKAGRLLEEPLLDLRGRVSNGTEQGLLGLAFAPGFRDGGRVYAHYTDLAGDAHVVRYTVKGDAVDASTRQELLFIEDPAPVHNAGQLQFGPDGFLYIALGDGGRNGASAQNLSRPFGKILRMDVSGDAPRAPPDNPFVDVPGAVPWTWVLGLRNPWHFSFDRATGDLWIGDVGHSTREEVDLVPAGQKGLNFGWNKWEGTRRNIQGEPFSEVTWPVAEYDHDVGCAVMGGYVYRGAAIPSLQGTYLYGDFCKGIVWGLTRTASGTWESSALADTEPLLTAFGEDEDGELLVTFHRGQVYRIVPA